MNQLPVLDAMKHQYSVDLAKKDPGVMTVQAFANHRGKQQIAVDGLFGPHTKAAIESLQRAHGAAIDGIVGPQTWQILFEGRMVHAVNHDVYFYSQKAHDIALTVAMSGKSTVKVPFIFDTGAFEALITQAWADKIGGLPNLGSTSIGGVVSHENAYMSEVDVQFGNVSFKKVECIVVPQGFSNLWGLKFADKRGYSIDANRDQRYIAYYR